MCPLMYYYGMSRNGFGIHRNDVTRWEQGWMVKVNTSLGGSWHDEIGKLIERAPSGPIRGANATTIAGVNVEFEVRGDRPVGTVRLRSRGPGRLLGRSLAHCYANRSRVEGSHLGQELDDNDR